MFCLCFVLNSFFSFPIMELIQIVAKGILYLCICTWHLFVLAKCACIHVFLYPICPCAL